MNRLEYKELSRQERLDNQEEIFKDIPWYEWRYKISNKWNIQSLLYKTYKILKPSLTGIIGNQYLSVVLSLNNKLNTSKVHRLVAITFIPNPLNLPCVNHINWNKLNNNDCNLEWCTHSENSLHSYRIWLRTMKVNHPILSYNKGKFGIDNKKSISIYQFSLEWEFIKEFIGINDTWRKLNISFQNIWKCCKWKRKSAWWYKWTFNI